jgi:hypothetical protein
MIANKAVTCEDSLVTSFPKRRGERRDESHGTKTPDQNLQLPRVIRRAFNSAKDPEVIYHDMVKKAIQYQPTIKIRYKHATYTATYLEIFSKEVQRIVSVTLPSSTVEPLVLIHIFFYSLRRLPNVTMSSNRPSGSLRSTSKDSPILPQYVY